MHRTPPPSRTRRIAKWTGLVVCVVILAMWAVSLKWWVTYRPAGYFQIRLADGVTIFLCPSDSVNVGVSYLLYPSRPFGLHFQRRPHWTKLRTGRRVVVGWSLPTFSNVKYEKKPSRRGPFGFALGPKGKALAVELPFWLPFTLAAIPTVILWHRDRRPKPGHCRQCGYDLRASKKTCPECGTAILRQEQTT